MNKSIYKKQLAFKNSLPQYSNGGNFFGKAGAGAMGLISKVPGVSMLTPLMEESKIVKKNKASFDIGQGIGDLGMMIPKALTGDIGGAVSSGLSAGNEFMQGGSEIAENRGNTERAERLDKAAMGFQAGSQVAGMTSMFTGGAAGGGTGGFNFNSVLGFDPTKLGGNTPVVMKNGGKLNKLGVENSLWNNIRANAGSGKKPTPEMLEQERKIKAKYEDGGGIHIDPAKRGTFKAQATRMGMGVQEAASKILNAPEGTYSPAMRKKANFAKNFAKEDGGLIQYNLPEHSDGGGAIDQNGKVVNPNSPLAVAELEKTETLDTKQNYVFSDTLKPMKSKLTFADLSKRIDNKYKGKTDDISVNSKDKELERLANLNEQIRLAKEMKQQAKDAGATGLKKEIRKDLNDLRVNRQDLLMNLPSEAPPLSPIMKNGGKLPKYFNGGDYNPYGLGSGTVDTFGTNQTESMNTMTPSVMLGNYSAKNIVPESTIPFNVMKPTSLTNTQNLGPSYPGSEMLFKSNTLPDQNLGKNYKVGKATDSNVKNSGLSMGDKAQLAGLAPATIYNTIQALRPAEKFSPLNSPYFSAGLNDMNQNVRFNTNPILMNRNVGINQINQGSTSDAVRRANLQSLYRGTNTQLGEMAEKEALTNAQIKQSLGQAKIGVGAQDVAAQERARQYNVQARQAKQQFGATAASQFGQGLTEFGKSSNQNLSNRIGYDVLKSISPNFTLADYNRLVKAGMSDGEIIKFINK